MIQISLNKEDELNLVQIVNCKAGEGELVGWQADYWMMKNNFKWQVTVRLGDLDMAELSAKAKMTIGEIEELGLFYEVFVNGNTNSKIMQKNVDKQITE
jgi:hypothetical protein